MTNTIETLEGSDVEHFRGKVVYRSGLKTRYLEPMGLPVRPFNSKSMQTVLTSTDKKGWSKEYSCESVNLKLSQLFRVITSKTIFVQVLWL